MNPPKLSSKPRLHTHRSVRTLLVDDSQFMREYLSILLRREGGFELVGTATDGREALGCVTALKPDLVLMDVNMPCLDGIEATRSIKQSGRQSGYAPAIVIVTSEDTLACRSRAEKAGANGFVSKTEDLRAQLKSTLENLFPLNEEWLLADLIEAGHECSCAYLDA